MVRTATLLATAQETSRRIIRVNRRVPASSAGYVGRRATRFGGRKPFLLIARSGDGNWAAGVVHQQTVDAPWRPTMGGDAVAHGGLVADVEGDRIGAGRRPQLSPRRPGSAFLSLRPETTTVAPSEASSWAIAAADAAAAAGDPDHLAPKVPGRRTLRSRQRSRSGAIHLSFAASSFVACRPGAICRPCYAMFTLWVKHHRLCVRKCLNKQTGGARMRTSGGTGIPRDPHTERPAWICKACITGLREKVGADSGLGADAEVRLWRRRVAYVERQGAGPTASTNVDREAELHRSASPSKTWRRCSRESSSRLPAFMTGASWCPAT